MTSTPSSAPTTPLEPGAAGRPVKTPIYRSLFVQLIVAIVLGVSIGFYFPDLGEALRPLGDGFIRLIKMIIAPLIFLVVVTGISHVGDVKAVGRIGTKALGYFLAASSFALLFGMVVGNLLTPGAGLHIDPSSLSESAVEETTEGGSLPEPSEFLLNVIPESVVGAFAENQLLQVLFFAVFVGAAIIVIGRERAAPVVNMMEAGLDIIFTVMTWIMKVAPIGALGAMAFIIGQYGIETLGTYAKLILACYLAGAVFVGFLFVIALTVAKVPLWKFIKYTRTEFGLAIGTASTESVLPRIITKLTNSGCSRAVSGFVVPTGYSFNLDGAAIYLSISVLFLTQAFDIQMSLGEQLGALGILLLTSKGMAGVPGSSFLALSATAAALGLFPVAGVALLLGADRVMDSMRVTVNLLGNCVATFVVARWEGQLDYDKMRRTFAGEPVEPEPAAASVAAPGTA